VYNLEIESRSGEITHNYFVGQDGVLVHNGDAPAPGRPTSGNTGGEFQPGKKGSGSGHYKYHPKFGKKGWIDKKGCLWVPEDHGKTHAPHWDVQSPGGGYRPVYPTN